MKSNLSKKVITDKNGHRRTVWVRADNNISKKKHKVPFEPKAYYKTMSGAIDNAVKYAESRGYKVDDDDVFSQLSTGGVNYGDTRKASIELTKDGKVQKKMLQVQIYRMDSGNYELNAYIN